MFEVLVAVVGAHMLGHWLVLVIKGEPISIDPGREGRARPRRRDRVTVGLKDHTETAINGQGAYQGRVVGQGRDGFEFGLLLRKEFQRCFSCLAVEAEVGDGFQPMTGRRIERGPGGQVQAAQEVLLDELHAVLDAAFGLGRELHPIRTNRNSFSRSLTHFIPGAADVLS